MPILLFNQLNIDRVYRVYQLFKCMVYNNNKSKEMIHINTKSDPRIAEDFPDDPYSNLKITTETQVLNLQSAFLAMDSGYFAKIDPDAQQIDLRHLKQQPLIKVLHSLYGQQLIAHTVGQLVELYPIIVALQIDDYMKVIGTEVKNRKQVLESLQFMELSYRYKLCWEEVVEVHLEKRLRMLEDSRKFLQLGKIQNQTFQRLLQLFIERYGNTEDKVLNNVMENYFNRKKIKPIAYLNDPKLGQLQAIWLKFHHVPLSELTPKSSPTLNPNGNPFESILTVKSSSYIASNPNIPPQSSPYYSSSQNMIGTEQTKNMSKVNMKITANEVEERRKKVAQLEKEVSDRDATIQELSQKIQNIKKQLGFRPELSKPMTVRSLLIEADVEKVRGRRQSKRLEDLFGDGIQQHESVSDHRRGSVKNAEGRQSKNMHRLGSKNLKKP